LVDHAATALLGAAEVRQLADRLGIRPAKRLGQNFVIDSGTIRRIVALAKLSDEEVVLEVGPGLGSLTLGLLEAAGARAGTVTAIEIDRVLAAELPVTVAAKAGDLAARLTVVTGDAVTISALPGKQPDILVANLPYNVAVPIMLNVLEVLPSIQRALVMVQAEVADRICAPPGSRTYGIPSVKLAWYGSARRVGTIARTVFWPVPNVDSALVGFTRWAGRDGGRGLTGPGPGPASQVRRAAVFEVIDAAFAQRRKTLRAALAPWAGSAGVAEQILRAAGVDPALRGEAIDVAQYIRIAEAAGAAGSIIESWRK
jgi:16S rRNA (adenine1518-N6/adenine1519-N6)-dimethyltransferase